MVLNITCVKLTYMSFPFVHSNLFVTPYVIPNIEAPACRRPISQSIFRRYEILATILLDNIYYWSKMNIFKERMKVL